MSKFILLTGGAGFIGSHTAVELISAGYNVIIADDLSNSSEDVIDRIETITGIRPVFFKCSSADLSAMDKIFSDYNIDAVIHFAGFKAVGESVAHPVKYYRNNIDTVLTVLELMEKHHIKRFIFSSSATVYSANANPPFTESTPTGDCTNPYGYTKHMIEQILRDTAIATPDFSVVLLRYFNPIGAHESGLIGDRPNGIPNNLMPYITQVAAGIREKLSVFGNDYPTHDGTGVRDYIHITDLAKGHVAALKYTETHTGAEAVNLGTGKGYSVLDIINAFEKANNIKIPYDIAPRRPGDIAASFADSKKAADLLNWHAEKDLEDMCRDSWRWQKTLEKAGNP